MEHFGIRVRKEKKGKKKEGARKEEQDQATTTGFVGEIICVIVSNIKLSIQGS